MKVPQQARTEKAMLSLARDNIGGKDWWFILDPFEVVICNQRSGEEPTGKVRLRRRDFDRLVRWYTTGRIR